MSTRRISRGTPAMLTKAEQEQYVRFLEQHPEHIEAVETLTGKALGALTFQEKVFAVAEVLEAGRSAAALTGAFKGLRDLQNLAGDARGDISLADQLALREQEVERLREQLAAAQEQAKTARADAVSARAKGARAVNSGEPAA